MSSRSKEKLAGVFTRLFTRAGRGGDPERERDREREREKERAEASPGRRLLRHCHPRSGPQVTPAPEKQPSSAQGGSGSGGGATGGSKCVRTRRLMKELQDIQRSGRKDAGFSVELINDNLYDWLIRLRAIDAESELAADMRELAIPHISLQLSFPENFPFVPPFMRVVAPRIEKGFVMEGGAICMELLTPRGWASAYTVEAIVMQFAASIVKGQGRISKKNKNTSKDFNRRSAEESFRSLVKTHDKYGWVTPPLADG